jgi:hypothetical protein
MEAAPKNEKRGFIMRTKNSNFSVPGFSALWLGAGVLLSVMAYSPGAMAQTECSDDSPFCMTAFFLGKACRNDPATQKKKCSWGAVQVEGAKIIERSNALSGGAFHNDMEKICPGYKYNENSCEQPSCNLIANDTSVQLTQTLVEAPTQYFRDRRLTKEAEEAGAAKLMPVVAYARLKEAEFLELDPKLEGLERVLVVIYQGSYAELKKHIEQIKNPTPRRTPKSQPAIPCPSGTKKSAEDSSGG